ncbi:MAG TPA: hypothetical protein VLA56_01915 [Pseudomonadales bacterium]|nr:hypothetical protein [Pseudomonadales bacterium]
MSIGFVQILWVVAGAVASAATIGGFRAVGFTRDRATWPLVTIAIALAYVALATGAGAPIAMGMETLLSLPFIALAIVAFHRNRFFLVGALVGHALLDLLHVNLLQNPGVPSGYPWLCLGFDLVLAGWVLAHRS